MTPIDITRFEQLKASGDLPAPTGVALAIMRLGHGDDATMVELASVIRSDSVLVGRLMKVANGISSPGFGRRPVVSVQEALMALGTPAVRALALSFSLVSEYSNGACPNFDYGSFWSYSLLCGLAMQAITARTRVAAAEEAFCVGLLARVGELALATLYPTAYSEILANRGSGSQCVRIATERATFGTDHRELSTAMLADWGIPKVFTEAVLAHETPDETALAEGSRQYIATQSLALARHIAEICLAPDRQRASLVGRLLLLGSRLSLDEGALITLSDRTVQEWHEWSAQLSLDTLSQPSFRQMFSAPPECDGSFPIREPIEDQQRLRVLVVADNPSLCSMLRSVLEAVGNEVFETTSGREALRLTLEMQPHMMIADWAMPEMDGMELTRALRQTKNGRAVFIVMLTSVGDDERLIEAFENGVDDFMPKPLRPRLLAARLRAGQRIIKLQQEIERDREEIRHFAAELAVTNRRLQEVALTDVLTGFPNRRYGMERIQQEWAASVRSGRTLACLMIDLDEFKEINDTYGHDVGDNVLKTASKALKNGLRAQDVICRIGGDEFLVICPDTGLEAALVCAERVRHSVESVRTAAGMLKLTSTVSIGVAVREPGISDADTLIKRADQGAYLAKQRGRNRVATVQATP